MTIRDDLLALSDDHLRRGDISADYLVFMDFKDAPRRWWTGWGALGVGGHTWQGVGNLIDLSDLPMDYAATATSVTFTVSAATQEMLTLAQQATDRVYGRDVQVFHQFFDVAVGPGGPWTPLGPAFSVYSGWMDEISFKAERDQTGVLSRRIEVKAEGVFARRNAPASGRWTDADQKRRYPGDKGCERMPTYMNYSPIWTA